MRATLNVPALAQNRLVEKPVSVQLQRSATVNNNREGSWIVRKDTSSDNIKIRSGSSRQTIFEELGIRRGRPPAPPTERELTSREYYLGHHQEQIRLVQSPVFNRRATAAHANPADHFADHLAHRGDALLTFRPLRLDKARVAASMSSNDTLPSGCNGALHCCQTL